MGHTKPCSLPDLTCGSPLPYVQGKQSSPLPKGSRLLTPFLQLPRGSLPPKWTTNNSTVLNYALLNVHVPVRKWQQKTPVNWSNWLEHRQAFIENTKPWVQELTDHSALTPLSSGPTPRHSAPSMTQPIMISKQGCSLSWTDFHFSPAHAIALKMILKTFDCLNQ